MIADEVLSGFGRTGRWFAVDHDGVAPDIVTCAKGLTGGYAPGGAVIVNEPIARYFDDQVLSCGLTAYAHPLTCAAIVAAIGAYRDERLVPRAARLGETLGARLRDLAAGQPSIRAVRGVGLLWALELAEKPGGPAPASGARMRRLAAELRQRRLHLHKRDNLLFLAPPLVIEEADLEDGVRSVGEALAATWAGPPERAGARS